MNPTIYLMFAGNCLEAMTLYANTIGGTILHVSKNSDVPDPSCAMPGGPDLVMHLSMQVPGGFMMASDCPPEMYQAPRGFSVSLAPETRAEFDRLFSVLAADAKDMMMPPDETFWAERFAMFTDRFGTPWMLNFTGNKNPGAAA